ncbi:putative uncharacterized protein [Microcella alkaliphila]|uniref:Uncharacterized protein n=1 Tax=Microcella alkaliphila TaxID=279828 RepID=A0A0U5BRB2_9MICO|nr:putative uncharacterized protein [Microcella alkaliphila]
MSGVVSFVAHPSTLTSDGRAAGGFSARTQSDACGEFAREPVRRANIDVSVVASAIAREGGSVSVLLPSRKRESNARGTVMRAEAVPLPLTIDVLGTLPR